MKKVKNNNDFYLFVNGRQAVPPKGHPNSVSENFFYENLNGYEFFNKIDQFEEHGLTILVQKCDWNKLTSFSQLPDCSSPDFCQKMNFNSFHQRGV